ncbi:MAG TPA: alpha/beta fold hydrolase [Burkholderiaceae bacterium]|nr:alpha/beta fold hydrolase [Burkholderiaceae bacterium]
MQVSARGVAIEVDDQGPPNGEPLLMIMGLGMQLIAWPDALVHKLIARGFRVIRIDNRDVGLSQSFDAAGVPNLIWAAMRHAMHLPVASPYRLSDMAGDALGVLDALNLQRVHVCGASMGGMIAQHIASAQPQRVKSLTLMMTTSGARGLPRASAHVQRALLSRPRGSGDEAVAAHLEHILALIGSPAYRGDPAAIHARVLAGVRRSYRPAGTARQLVAIVADGDRSPLLARIGAPTRVIHGDADPLVPVQCGLDLVRRIAGAEVDVVPGMGHDLPEALFDRFADGIRDNAARAAA